MQDTSNSASFTSCRSVSWTQNDELFVSARSSEQLLTPVLDAKHHTFLPEHLFFSKNSYPEKLGYQINDDWTLFFIALDSRFQSLYVHFPVPLSLFCLPSLGFGIPSFKASPQCSFFE